MIFLFLMWINGVFSQDSELLAALNAHNKYRQIHQSGNLKLNEKLSQEAKAYARQLAQNGVLRYQKDISEGENLAYGCQPDGHFTLEDATKMWYKELCNPGYDFNNGRLESKTAHFTQLVWKSSKELGMGSHTVDKNNRKCTYIVARYKPAGNYAGLFDYNVKRGIFTPESCGSTPKNTTHRKYRINKTPDEIDQYFSKILRGERIKETKSENTNLAENAALAKNKDHSATKNGQNSFVSRGNIESWNAKSNQISKRVKNEKKNWTDDDKSKSSGEGREKNGNNNAIKGNAGQINALGGIDSASVLKEVSASEIGNNNAKLESAGVGITNGVSGSGGTGLENSDAGLGKGNAGVGNTQAGSGNTGAGLGNGLAGLGSDVTGLGNGGAGLGNVAPGLGGSGAGLGNVAAGLGNGGVGLGNVAGGLGNGDAGLGDGAGGLANTGAGLGNGAAALGSGGGGLGNAVTGSENGEGAIGSENGGTGLGDSKQESAKGGSGNGGEVLGGTGGGLKVGVTGINASPGIHGGSGSQKPNKNGNGNNAAGVLDGLNEAINNIDKVNSDSAPSLLGSNPGAGGKHKGNSSASGNIRPTRPSGLSSGSSDNVGSLSLPNDLSQMVADKILSGTALPNVRIKPTVTNAVILEEKLSPLEKAIAESAARGAKEASLAYIAGAKAGLQEGLNIIASQSGAGDENNCSPFDQAGVEAHNAFRKIHDAPDLTLDDKLSAKAEEYAKKLAKSGELRNSSNLENTGENLAYGCYSEASMELSPADAVKSWYNEVCDPGYNFKSNRGSRRTAHFTNVIWKDSHLLGIGRAKGKKGKEYCTYIVAYYQPRGNSISKYQDNVLQGSFSHEKVCSSLDNILEGIDSCPYRGEVIQADAQSHSPPQTLSAPPSPPSPSPTPSGTKKATKAKGNSSPSATHKPSTSGTKKPTSATKKLSPTPKVTHSTSKTEKPPSICLGNPCPAHPVPPPPPPPPPPDPCAYGSNSCTVFSGPSCVPTASNICDKRSRIRKKNYMIPLRKPKRS